MPLFVISADEKKLKKYIIRNRILIFISTIIVLFLCVFEEVNSIFNIINSTNSIYRLIDTVVLIFFLSLFNFCRHTNKFYKDFTNLISVYSHDGISFLDQNQRIIFKKWEDISSFDVHKTKLIINTKSQRYETSLKLTNMSHEEIEDLAKTLEEYRIGTKF